ncbi:MAG TPA: 50S ribosomal protein L18 [Methanobacterium sp.]|nr:50S ribosomal protein L18 [Methanobacterium sp.]
MAHTSRYKLAFKRRKEGKTDYKARLKLIGQNKHRFVVRISNKHIIAQVVTIKQGGDETLVAVNSKELENLGWKAGGKNLSAAYLTGFLCGKQALKKDITEATLDIGLKTSFKGSKIYAVLKGAVDAGLNIPHNESVIPAEDRINGEHIAQYGKDLSDAEIKQKFSKYVDNGLEPSKLPEHFTAIKEKIEEELS